MFDLCHPHERLICFRRRFRSRSYGIVKLEDVSEVLVCYALWVFESPSNLQRNRVTS
jgi:hypothetical protein